MPFKIVRNDITKMQVDAIVNTANSMPGFSRGTDTAVYMAAGVEKLLAARESIGYLEESEVAITPGFALPAKYIIHAVSPRYIDGTHQEADKLRKCYSNCLKLATKNGCQSIAFPLVSTGSFGYPKAEGLEIALNVIHTFLMREEMMIYLVVFDDESMKLSGQIFDDIESYIDENYVEEQRKAEYTDYPSIGNADFDGINISPTAVVRESASKDYIDAALQKAPKAKKHSAKRPTKPSAKVPTKRSLDEIMATIGETFQQKLFRLIDERNLNEVEVYKRAGKDKKFFHKVRCNINYQPNKYTVFAFAIAMELSLDELKDLLKSAGFALSPSNKYDLIMQYVFEQGIYDIYKIDCILYDFGENHFLGCDH